MHYAKPITAKTKNPNHSAKGEVKHECNAEQRPNFTKTLNCPLYRLIECPGSRPHPNDSGARLLFPIAQSALLGVSSVAQSLLTGEIHTHYSIYSAPGAYRILGQLRTASPLHVQFERRFSLSNNSDAVFIIVACVVFFSKCKTPLLSEGGPLL